MGRGVVHRDGSEIRQQGGGGKSVEGACESGDGDSVVKEEGGRGWVEGVDWWCGGEQVLQGFVGGFDVRWGGKVRVSIGIFGGGIQGGL